MKKRITYLLQEADFSTTDGSLKAILSRRLHLSRHEISRLKYQPDGLLCRGRKLFVNDHLQPGDVLELCFPDSEAADVPLTQIQPVILYEDEDLVIADKPAGMPSHPSHGHLEDSLGSILSAWYSRQNKPFVIRPIGRLDKDVSGVMLYAKNQPAAARLSQQRLNGSLTKEYLAVAEGIFAKSSGILDSALQKQPGSRRRICNADGQPAQTEYTVLRVLSLPSGDASLLQVHILTGRTHQIRAHLAAAGHPLLGDRLYGGKAQMIARPALHCYSLQLCQPFTGQPIAVKATLPDDLAVLLKNKKTEAG